MLWGVSHHPLAEFFIGFAVALVVVISILVFIEKRFHIWSGKPVKNVIAYHIDAAPDEYEKLERDC